MLKLKNISHQYGNAKDNALVLSDINLHIRKNEFVSIIGPSGCGKTTLVNIIAGYIKPTKGEIIINGKKKFGPDKNRIVINQEHDLFDWMTVYNNLKIVTKDEKDIIKLLKITDLEPYKNRYPHQLSGGMKKRLSLARALAVKSNFIIMDEPFSSQDYLIKNKLHKELLVIAQKSQKTILLVTHDIEEAIFLSGRIIVLGGSPAKIIDEHIIKENSNIKEKFVNGDEFYELKRQLRSIGYNI